MSTLTRTTLCNVKYYDIKFVYRGQDWNKLASLLAVKNAVCTMKRKYQNKQDACCYLFLLR